MKALYKTNPYLKDKKLSRLQNLKSTRTSCGVEGIVSTGQAKINIKLDTSKTNAIFQKIQSRLKNN